MKIKCIIADDEQLARQLLKSYVDKMPHLELVGMCKNAIEVLALMQKESVDLLLLDIQMPDLSGIALLKAIKTPPIVIFITAYKEYALEGYELNVIDYLLKPVSFERFVTGVNKAIEIRKLQDGGVNKEEVKRDEQIAIVSKNYITIKADHKLHKVYHQDLLFIEGMREYVSFRTETDKIMALESLKKLEELLPADSFMRVHKSFIINSTKVRLLSGNQIYLNGHDSPIPVGKNYKNDVLKMFA